MALRLTIETDNAAFAGDDLAPELAAILRKVAEAIERGTIGAPIHDSNGNRVGRFAYDEHRPEPDEEEEQSDETCDVCGAHLDGPHELGCTKWDTF